MMRGQALRGVSGLAVAILIVATASCAGEKKEVEEISKRVFAKAAGQAVLMDARLAPGVTPRTFEDGVAVDSNIRWWCSGFYPGTLWLIYEYSGGEDIRLLAEKHTQLLDSLVYKKTDHDIGFQVNCSFGNAYRLTGDGSWLGVYEAACAKLAKRFSPVVGCIRSWDSGEWDYPVIIDNMMNLELLLRGAELFGADSLRQIALSHADVTLKNHFRKDNSSYHLVDYDPQTGEVLGRQTVQGFSDDSAWARGQSWALYGFTMMYRMTGVQRYLDQAVKIADMLISRLPEDGIPYWDYDSPDIPEDFRDTSAGAIMASALAELDGYSPDKGYRGVALRQVRALASDEYLAPVGKNGNFLLMHSVGNKPGGSEVDVPLTYADYYLLEALLRLRR